MVNLPVPVPRTFSVSEIETAAYLNTIRDALNFLLNPPFAIVTQATPQTVTSGAQPVITFDTTIIDTYGGHSNVTNNSRYTAQVAGWYQVTVTAAYAANATANRAVQTAKNGTIQTRGQEVLFTPTAANTATIQATSKISLVVGDYVEAIAFQNSGGN